ncbi:MAG: CoA transferase [Nocardioidaceae bacterium]
MTTTPAPARLPLEGIRVIEMCWVWSGPMMGQYLADLGAEVIKVEWYERYDLYRTRGVERLRHAVPEDVRREMSFSFHSLNRGKLGFAADLKDEASMDVFKQLLARSDLLIENFTLGTLERLGLGPEVLRAINDRLVVVSLSASGQGSGLEKLRAYGLVLSALGGAETEFVDADGQFVGSPSFVVSDPNAAAFGAFAAAAGLLHARRSGRGAHLEGSQIEAMTTLMTADRSMSEPRSEHVVLATLDGHVAVSLPRGVDVFGGDDPAVVAGTRSSDELVHLVCDAGGSAAPVRNLADNELAPEYVDADVRVPTLHPVTGAETVVAAPWRMSGERPVVRKPAPQLGESNGYVLRRVLGLSEDDIAALDQTGSS